MYFIFVDIVSFTEPWKIYIQVFYKWGIKACIDIYHFKET